MFFAVPANCSHLIIKVMYAEHSAKIKFSFYAKFKTSKNITE